MFADIRLQFMSKETIFSPDPVAFGAIQVVPVWRFLLEMEPQT